MEETTSRESSSPPPSLQEIESSQSTDKKNSKLLVFSLLILTFILIIGIILYSVQMMRTKDRFKDSQSSNNQVITPSPSTVKQLRNEKLTITIEGKKITFTELALQNKEQLPIISIEKYILSPDASTVALLANGGISPYFLYLSDSNGKNIVYIGTADEVVWSQSGKYIAYTAPLTDIGPDVFTIYDLVRQKTLELEDNRFEEPTDYSNLIWSKDEQSLKADYITYKIPGGDKLTSGTKTYFLNQFTAAK